jgi:RNA polymerase sigma factor for flagellar operon FliA
MTELQKEDLKLLITRALSPTERLIVILYYYEEMTIKEIALTLDLPESRARRIRRAALTRLKKRLTQEDLF